MATVFKWVVAFLTNVTHYMHAVADTDQTMRKCTNIQIFKHKIKNKRFNNSFNFYTNRI